MISVIIPCYNQAEYLAEAIESVLIQRIKSYDTFELEWKTPEIIVVNDGSTDNFYEVVKKYPVKVISQVNKGLASARNTGLMNTTNTWVLFLDADDKLLPRALEEIGKDALPSYDIVAPSFRTFGTTNQDVILMVDPTLEDFKTANRIGYCAAIRRAALLEVGGYNPKMVKGFEDWDLWFDLLKRGKKIITIPEVLWMYRTKENSMYTEANKHRAELEAQIKLNHPDVFR